MKRYVFAAAIAFAVVALAAVLTTHGVVGDHSLIVAMAGTAAVSADDLKALTTQLTTIEKSMAQAADDVKKNGETMQTEIKNLGKATSETTEKVDKALSQHGELAGKHGEVAARVTEIEQKLAARRSEQEPAGQKSMGERFVESAEYKGFKGKGAVRVEMNRADITSVTGTVGNNTSPANSLVGSMRIPTIVAPPERRLTIRDLIAPGETDQGNVEYPQETGFTNNAAVVTEGATKPKSDLTFELKNAPVRTIAHIFKASRQILDDAKQLRSYIDARARYGLRLSEEAELLNGDGTGVHLKGLVPSASNFDAAFTPANQTNIDVIRLAILQVFLANFPPNGIVLHPTDWAKIQLTKDGQQRYIIGNPQDGNTPRLWNLPVVESQSMTYTEFLVGAFDLGAQIFDRMEIEVLLSTENVDDFEKNMVTLRAEERLALAIYRPESFVHGDFDTAT